MFVSARKLYSQRHRHRCAFGATTGVYGAKCASVELVGRDLGSFAATYYSVRQTNRDSMRRPSVQRAAINLIDRYRDVGRHNAGACTTICAKCEAMRWATEKPSICCHNGKTISNDKYNSLKHPGNSPCSGRSVQLSRIHGQDSQVQPGVRYDEYEVRY